MGKIEKGVLNTSDPVLFRIIPEILNALGFRKPDGGEYVRWWQGTYGIGENAELWFADLSREKADTRYTNVWHGKTEEIYEYETAGRENNWQELIARGKFFRYAFCKENNPPGDVGYKFYGKFELVSKKIEHDPQGRYLIWKKVGDEIRIADVNPGKK